EEVSGVSLRGSLGRLTPGPAPVAPRRQAMPLTSNVWHRIEPVRAPGMAPADARQRQPAPAPGAVAIDGVEGVLRARRQVPAFRAHQRLQRPAIGVHRHFDQGLPGGGGEVFGHALHCTPAAATHDRPYAEASTGAASVRLASALASAISTASNTKRVE